MSTSLRWTGTTTKRWRDERISKADPKPKKPRLVVELQPDEVMDQDQSMLEVEMPCMTTEGAPRPKRKCWRQARRETGRPRITKGTTLKITDTVKPKEWNGGACDGRKRKLMDLEDTFGSEEDLYMEPEVKNTKVGESLKVPRPQNGGKILLVEGAKTRGVKKKRKIQSNRITNYFGNPLGFKDDQLGNEEDLLKLTDSSLNLSVKSYRPATISVFEKEFRK